MAVSMVLYNKLLKTSKPVDHFASTLNIYMPTFAFRILEQKNLNGMSFIKSRLSFNDFYNVRK